MTKLNSFHPFVPLSSIQFDGSDIEEKENLMYCIWEMRTFALATKEWWIRNYLKMIGTISSLWKWKKLC